MDRVRFLMVADSRGHTAGYYAVSRALRDAGVEVVLGGFLPPAGIIEVAAQEDVDFIGYRIMDREPVSVVAPLMELLRENGMEHIRVIVGGIVPPSRTKTICDLGVEKIFRPGSRLEDIAAFVKGEAVVLPSEPAREDLGMPVRLGI
ncbi:MAG: cobalamin B12-binding domain-containing protein [Thermoflexaceae bacterium]|nr:cobalamin B12-binding domain-containing protein [Thermoflexaceae bacterium]